VEPAPVVERWLRRDLLPGLPSGSLLLVGSRRLDLVAALLARLVDEVPSEDHRAAIEWMALSRVTTRSLLREQGEPGRADELFDWLAAQPWVDRLPGGLCPHDLARDVIEADLRNNDPDRHRSVIGVGRSRRQVSRPVGPFLVPEPTLSPTPCR
jgi:hypothetical protein